MRPTIQTVSATSLSTLRLHGPASDWHEHKLIDDTRDAAAFKTDLRGSTASSRGLTLRVAARTPRPPG